MHVQEFLSLTRLYTYWCMNMKSVVLIISTKIEILINNYIDTKFCGSNIDALYIIYTACIPTTQFLADFEIL